MNFQERLTPAQGDEFNAALEDFENHRDLDRLYDDLVNSGLYPEEAEEYCNLITGDSTLD